MGKPALSRPGEASSVHRVVPSLRGTCEASMSLLMKSLFLVGGVEGLAPASGD